MSNSNISSNQYTPFIAQLEGVASMGASASHLVLQSLVAQSANVVERLVKENERLEAKWRAEGDAYIDAKDEIERLVHDVEQASKAAGIEAMENERLRAALASIGEYDCPGGVHPKHCLGCAACDANKALSGDGPVHETKTESPISPLRDRAHHIMCEVLLRLDAGMRVEDTLREMIRKWLLDYFNDVPAAPRPSSQETPREPCFNRQCSLASGHGGRCVEKASADRRLAGTLNVATGEIQPAESFDKECPGCHGPCGQCDAENGSAEPK